MLRSASTTTAQRLLIPCIHGRGCKNRRYWHVGRSWSCPRHHRQQPQSVVAETKTRRQCDDTDGLVPAGHRYSFNPTPTSRRHFGIYRNLTKSELTSPVDEELAQEQYLDSLFSYDESDLDDEEDNDEAEAEEERQQIRDELDQKTGRLWTDPWEITEEDWSAGKTYDDLPDWEVQTYCSRVSWERVKVHPDGIPTLSNIATLPLPPPPPPHPGHGLAKQYVRHRKKSNVTKIYSAVQSLAEPQIPAILAMETWEEKQLAIDELFENVEEELRRTEGGDIEVLSKHPNFGSWVERTLEGYLRKVEERERTAGNAERLEGDDGAVAASMIDEEGIDEVVVGDDASEGDDASGPFAKATVADEEEIGTLRVPTDEEDGNAVPLFMDLIGGGGDVKRNDDEAGPDVNENGVPNILRPLNTHHKEGAGRMVEEWQLSAHDLSKRIMIRRCTRDIARLLVEATAEKKEEREDTSVSIFVTGKRGVGKTATLASIVASARASGHIVLYMPDGDRFRKNGKYIEPSNHLKGYFNLPVLAREVCTDFLASHEQDLDQFVVERECLEKYFTPDQMRKHIQPPNTTEGGDGEEQGGVPLVKLLQIGSNSNSLSSGCYLAVVDTLMNQTERPFLMVLDEFNCYYDWGHYFHMKYDENVRRAIPCELITLFRPALRMLGLSTRQIDDPHHPGTPKTMKRGGILVATTESRAVKRKWTEALLQSAQQEEEKDNSSFHVVEVPRYSNLEVEHVLSNFEVTGVGRLRFDQGDTVMNDQEVAYLRMVSGGVGQNLLDACII